MPTNTALINRDVMTIKANDPKHLLIPYLGVYKSAKVFLKTTADIASLKPATNLQQSKIDLLLTHHETMSRLQKLNKLKDTFLPERRFIDVVTRSRNLEPTKIKQGITNKNTTKLAKILAKQMAFFENSSNKCLNKIEQLLIEKPLTEAQAEAFTKILNLISKTKSDYTTSLRASGTSKPSAILKELKKALTDVVETNHDKSIALLKNEIISNLNIVLSTNLISRLMSFFQMKKEEDKTVTPKNSNLFA